ncbi:MAG: hypothetical protein RR317_03585 [Bilophila sp.]
MKVVFEITGLSCDLAMHPISRQTAEAMREAGRDIYSQKYMNWWRRGNTRTFGMRIGDSSQIRLHAGCDDIPFNATLLYRDVYTLRQRMYLASKAQFLAILGYDNETCTFRWIWNDIEDFDPTKFNFVVTDWDNVLDTKGYRVLDNVFYDGHHADDEEWLNPSGFTLMDPIVIDLDDVRREIENELKGTANYGKSIY